MAKKESKGAPKWTMTFADLSTLLLTFFVLMLSFANIDIEKFRDMLGSVQNAFGVQFREKGDFQAVADTDTSDIVQQEILAEKQIQQQKMQKAAEEIENIVKENELEDMTEVQVGANGIRIRITGHIMFGAGQAEVKFQAYDLLDGIAEAMRNFDYYLLVEGHTDDRPIHTAQFPSNWELSSARAAAVIRYLRDQGIDVQRLSGIGHAYNYPIADNATPEGRDQNRRVEFIFTRTPFRQVLD